MADTFIFLGKQDYRLSYIQENIEMILYAAVSFFLPLILGHPQMVVGVLVNTALVLAALNLKNYRLLPIIIFPALGVLSRGIIFGPYTIFLVYMIPFIWIGNSILVIAFKSLNQHLKINGWLTLAIGASLKAAFLFAIAYLLVHLKVIPVIFLTTMGGFQLYTALAGGIIAFGIQHFKRQIA